MKEWLASLKEQTYNEILSALDFGTLSLHQISLTSQRAHSPPPINSDGLNAPTPTPVSAAAPTSAIFIGKVPLTPCLDSFSLGDKITEAFHNSSRKTLSYVPPSLQNGEVIVRPSIDMIRNGSSRWKATAVGYFLGKRPYFHHLNDYVHSIWPAIREVTATATGFYFFQFKTEAAMEEVIEGGPWLFRGQPIVLQKWETGMALRKLKHTQVPVWIKLRHLLVVTSDGLSTVASGIGKPLYPDAITRACTRLDFAQVCVMLDISSKLPRHVIIMVPRENGGESAYKVAACAYKMPPSADAAPVLVVDLVIADADHSGEINMEPMVQRTDKAVWNVRGLNRRDHQVAVKNLVAESRLHFIGLLETRGTLPNATRVQSNLLPRWNWFTDYNNPGNRIWLVWDDEFLGIDIVDIGVQFIHCRILIRSLHAYVLVTIAYGDNEIGARRELWQALSIIAGDIWLAMNEFNDCILQAGLIALPMKGVRFSWHNCSTDGRSLWKRLDRMLVNDKWMERWPDAHYECLTPRTSDHSPLLLRGDLRHPQ
ncbi:UNVERIFIED_CONTAM: hypothetical protein Scaly_2215300 [Sesamum calycinum]|uniref:DUF4283 domain-containing protein n=1 Tax=Sesamum calycinum TaxID=2727403 RepID=A0AAW2MQF5_9LAMI